jgi:hypothetical protein
MPLRKNGTFKGALVALAIGAAMLPTAASAADSTVTCPEQPTTKAFSKIGDLADYALAPTGDFEHGLSGWKISGAGGIVSGNESLGILGGTHSLALGGGIVSGPTTITSPEFCVDQSHPYFRYLIKANGPVGLMATYIKYTAADGTTTSAQVQSTVSTSLLPGKWKASSLNPLSINIPLVANDGKAAKVQLMFVTPGSVLGAGYNIDNILVDPYRRG